MWPSQPYGPNAGPSRVSLLPHREQRSRPSSAAICFDQPIRIADIDTPELNGPCEHERDLALRARNRLVQLLNAGAFEIARKGQDRYGRTLATLHRSGRSIGDQLVAERLARTWSGRREPWCAGA